MRVLEDLGFYCVDNLPVALAPTVVELAGQQVPPIATVALGIDARERIFFPRWPQVFDELERGGIHPEIIFLDASDTGTGAALLREPPAASDGRRRRQRRRQYPSRTHGAGGDARAGHAHHRYHHPDGPRVARSDDGGRDGRQGRGPGWP